MMNIPERRPRRSSCSLQLEEGISPSYVESHGAHTDPKRVPRPSVTHLVGSEHGSYSSMSTPHNERRTQSSVSVSRRFSDAVLQTLHSIRKRSSLATLRRFHHQAVDISRFEVEEIIKRVHRPPTLGGNTMKAVLGAIHRKQFLERHFQQALAQTGMHHLTLLFSKDYEPAFANYLHQHARKRVRYCAATGFLLLLGSLLRDVFLSEEALAFMYLRIFLVLPSLLATIAVTFIDRLVPYIEWSTAITILVVGLETVIQKVSDQEARPLVNLFILLVPVFGLTRMRIVTSTLVGALLVTMYVAGSLAAGSTARYVLAVQTMNYLAGLFVGMVAHYRQELFRRRNYALCLPILAGSTAEDLSLHLQHSEKYKKRNFLKISTLQFRSQDVEEIFYRYWYLIDSFPFEHTNAGNLHEDVFRSIQFAVAGAVISQVAFSMQDLKFLGHSNETMDSYYLSVGLRFGVVIPLYLLSIIAMWYFGRRYVRVWTTSVLQQRSGNHFQHRNGIVGASSLPPPANPSSSSYAGSQESVLRGIRTHPLGPSPSPRRKRMGSEASTASNESFPESSNYVRVMQWLSAFIVVSHGLAMAIIMLAAHKHFGDDNVTRTYLLGLLNAVLFAHRSGFRVRFFYATIGTVLLYITFLLMGAVLLPSEILFNYGTYFCTMLCLGMMISYEEESLRRKFFVLRSLRMAEFMQWYDQILRIPLWIRRRMLQKAQTAREKLRDQGDRMVATNQLSVGLDGAELRAASRYGMYSTFVNVATGIVSEALSNGL